MINETTTGASISWASSFVNTEELERQKRAGERYQLINETNNLANILKTPDLAEANIELLNGLIHNNLIQLVECDCEEVDFTNKSLEEMMDMAEELGL